MNELEKLELKKRLWNEGKVHIEETEDINIEFELINRPFLRKVFNKNKHPTDSLYSDLMSGKKVVLGVGC